MSLDTNDDGPLHTFAIDTNLYAGNFERDFLAYVTGHSDYEGSNRYEELAKRWVDAKTRVMFENLLDLRIDDPGDDGFDRRHACILPTPGWTGDEENGHYLVTDDRPFKFPVYQSVGFFLQRRPTPDEIAVMKIRSHELVETGRWAMPQYGPTGLKITGFRLITEKRIFHYEDL